MGSTKILSAGQIRRFPDASGGIDFSGTDRPGVYQWVEETLQAYRYSQQSKEARGMLREFLGKMTGLSVPRTTRLAGQYPHTGQVRPQEYRRRQFPRQYGKQDIVPLAGVDQAHGRLSGPATKKILERECEVFGKTEFARLANVPVSHLYNLRHTATYLRRAVVMGGTTPTTVAIGERRRPGPRGRPGYVRIGTVHQPERDGGKSVYHINAVDEATQWEVPGCVPRISEHYLVPVVKAMLKQFPFRVRGFHSGNGSEFVNEPVAALLEKPRAEFTKSRPRRSNDNGLVETRNGAVVRKNIGHQWLDPGHAGVVDTFYQEWFNPYLNYHRPCGFARTVVGAKGKQTKVYDVYATPYERLKPLPKKKRLLKEGVTYADPDRIATTAGDTEFARKMRTAKEEMFRHCARVGAAPPAPLQAHAAGDPLPVHEEPARTKRRRRGTPR